MKATELMIGDWVQVPSLIDNVEYYDAWCKVKQLRDCDLDVIGFKELKYDEIEPIPLTPKILEKNGWEERPTGYVFYTDRKRYDNSLWYILGSNTFVVNRNEFQIKYVHELQHALRLLGIEKEIEL